MRNSTLRTGILGAVLATALIGCGNSTDMTAQEQAAFRPEASSSGPRSPEAQKAIADFAEEYRRKHPSSGGPPGGAGGGPPGPTTPPGR